MGLQKTSDDGTFPTNEDIGWLRENQPLLRLHRTSSGNLVIKGVLVVNHVHNKHAISDKYTIEIEFDKQNNFQPVAREIGGRLEAVMKKYAIKNKADLHLYVGDSLCLMPPQEMALHYLPNRSFKLLMETYVVPFFYSQSYYEHNYSKWPWRHYPHNHNGLLDWYIDNCTVSGAVQETIKAARVLKYDKFIERCNKRESFNPNSKCVCGSGRSYTRCGNQHILLANLARAVRFPSGTV